MTTSSIKSKHFSGGTVPIINTPSPNVTASFEGFALSYNPRHADYGSDTTAIVLKGRVFLLLNGDHGEALHEKAAENGITGCIDYFIEHIKEANHLSEHLMAVGLADDPFELQQTALDVIDQDNIDSLMSAVQEINTNTQEEVTSAPKLSI